MVRSTAESVGKCDGDARLFHRRGTLGRKHFSIALFQPLFELEAFISEVPQATDFLRPFATERFSAHLGSFKIPGRLVGFGASHRCRWPLLLCWKSF